MLKKNGIKISKNIKSFPYKDNVNMEMSYVISETHPEETLIGVYCLEYFDGSEGPDVNLWKMQLFSKEDLELALLVFEKRKESNNPYDYYKDEAVEEKEITLVNENNPGFFCVSDNKFGF